MFELVNKKRNNLKKNKKGFTLVEVIVVLVILAILAAILVPAMIGWINKANEKTVVVEARNVLLALQTIASDTYNPKNPATANWTQASLAATQKNQSKADDLKELTDDTAVVDKIPKLKVTGGKVQSFTYVGDDYQVTYNADTKFGDPTKKE